MTFEEKCRRKPPAYAGPGLHRVAQVTAEGMSLVLSVVAAGQLGQALRRQDSRVSHAQKDWEPRPKGGGLFQTPPGFPLTSLFRAIPT